MWSGSPAKRGSLDNYHHGISQPCSISCYFWAIPFEVSLCFICLSLNTAGLLGQARQLSSLTVGLSRDADCLSSWLHSASLVSWLTLVPIERMYAFFLFFFFFFFAAEDLSSSPCFTFTVFVLLRSEVCQRDPWLQQSQQSMSFVQRRIPWVTSHIN